MGVHICVILFIDLAEMQSENDHVSYSDGEVDSETEDNDAEKELGHWLEQLQAAGDVSTNGNCDFN